MISNAIYRVLGWLVVLLITPSLIFAVSLESALNKATKDFAGTFLKLNKHYEMIIDVVNIHSLKKDRTASSIETELYFALERQFPSFKLMLQSESLTGISLKKSVFIKGTYEQSGSKITLRLQGISGLQGEILAQTEVTFTQIQAARRTLVAVLDIEAKVLGEGERKAFSEIFRAHLSEDAPFEMASSAEVDKMDPDAIQQASGCSRDSCATIIGEQLGVDRVISTTIIKMGTNRYLLSGKMMDIQDGSIVRSVTVQHHAPLRNLDKSLKQLAIRIIGDSGGGLFGQSVTGSFTGTAAVQRITPKVTGNKSSSIAALFLNTTPQGAEVFIGSLNMGKTPFQNMNMTAGKTLRITFKHPGYIDKTAELILSGGINKVDTISLQSRFGILNINSNPEGARVMIAGQFIGQTPIQNHRISMGDYLITVEKEFYFPQANQRLTINPGETVKRQVTLKPNFGVLDLDSVPHNASFKLIDANGVIRQQGVTPQILKADTGKYIVKLEKSGYDSLEFTIAVPLGKSVSINASDAKLRKRQGTLIVSSDPYEEGAEVYFDGQRLGVVPGEFMVPAGQHALRVQSRYKEGSIMVNVVDRQTQSITVPLMDRFTRAELKKSHRNWKYGQYGALIGSALFTVYTVVENAAVEASNKEKITYLQKVQTAESQQQAQDYLDKAKTADEESQSHSKNAQIGGILATSAFGLWTYLYFNEPTDQDELSWIPVTGPDLHGLAWRVNF